MATVVPAADRDAATRLAGCLLAGGIAISPCDTIYGILGMAPGTEGQIRAIKGRGEQKPFIELHPSVDSVLAAAVQEIPRPLLELWPGALTLIIRTEKGSRGIRVPADPFLLEVLARTGPLFSTSVNKSGKPPLWRTEDISAAFANEVDMIVDGGDLKGIPSTIVDISVAPCKIVRQGAVQVPEEILKLCE